MNKLRMARSMTGSAMIEALLAAFLLSIALLGAAAVQVNSMRQINGVSARTLADSYARKMLESMRTNRAGLTSGIYNAVSATVADPGCLSTGCSTGDDIGKADINQFYSDVSNLPSGSGSVSGTGPQNAYTVTVTWLDTATQASQSWSVSAVLP